eukprot:gene21718-33413_t
MEIEAKIVLNSKEDFDKAVSLLGGSTNQDSILENYFFDGSKGELSGNGIMLRLRIKDNTSAELNIKSHTEVEQGAACRFARTEQVSVDIARQALSDPSKILPAVAELQRSYGFTSLKFLGGFRSNRKTCTTTLDKELVAVKLDEVMYSFGTHYEVELVCGQMPVGDMYSEMAKKLAANGINGSMGTLNKVCKLL